jgi:hypothetical protein
MSSNEPSPRDFTARVYKNPERTEHEDHEFTVKEPTLEDHNESTKVYNRTFRSALESGAILRASLTDYMEDQNLWSEEKQTEYNETQASLFEYADQLEKGGIKLSEAREIAFKMTELRNHLRELIADRTSLDANTAEGQADNEKFNCLVSCCVVYNSNGKRFYKDYAAFKSTTAIEVSLKGAKILANMMYGLDENFEKSLPENEFLVKYKLADENLRLIDKQGRFITRDGKLIDEFGFYVDEEGHRVTSEGKVPEETLFSPFIDDETGQLFDEYGNVIEEEKPKPKPKRKPKATKKAATLEA